MHLVMVVLKNISSEGKIHKRLMILYQDLIEYAESCHDGPGFEFNEAALSKVLEE